MEWVILLVLGYILVSVYLHYEKRFDRLEKMIEELKGEKEKQEEGMKDEAENSDG